MKHCNDPDPIDRCALTAPRVPGLADLHLMSLLLLSERAPDDGRMLVLATGEGLELKVFAGERPCWTFVAVDPSDPELDLASPSMGQLGFRVNWVHGYLDDAPIQRFDGATCLLSLHFLPRHDRLQLLRAVRMRLRPGAAFVVAHHSLPPGSDDSIWLARSAAFGAGPQADFAQAATSGAGMARDLHLLTEDQEVALLEEAGFTEVEMFYAGYSFRGWIAVA